MRLVDADKLKGALEKTSRTQGRPYYPNMAMSVIDRAPTVDAVLVTHGKWIANKYGEIICSNCGGYAILTMMGCLVDRYLGPENSRFCPNCGAIMDGGNV